MIGNAASLGLIKLLDCMHGIGLTWQPLQASIQPALPRPCSDRLAESNDILPLLSAWGRL